MGQLTTFTSVLPKKKPVRIGNIINNKWVKYEGRVGIVTQLEEDNAVFNAVGEDGITYASLNVNPYNLELAHFNDIPDIRKPSIERAAELGYSVQ